MNKIKKRLVKISTLVVVAGMVVWMAAGCMTQQQLPLDELFSPTPSLTTTATVDWFPMTATPQTVVPATVTPNPAADPLYGQTLFSDPFTDANNWESQQTANGIVSVSDGTITLAVKKTPASLAVIRQDSQYSNFYLVTTVKRVALCKNDDEIGLLFRVAGSESYYRVLVDCQGLLALQQVTGGTPAMLVNWMPSEQIPSGLWKSFTIGVWTYGNVIRLYINGQLQTEVNRDTFKSGGIGYFARAAGDTPLTVSFSDLAIYAVNSTIASGAAAMATP